MNRYPLSEPRAEKGTSVRMQTPQRRGRLFLVLIIAGLIFIAGCGLTYLLGVDPSNNPEDYAAESLEPKKPEGIIKKIQHFVFSKDKVLEGEKDDRINVLLLGMGGLGHDGPYLTDTIIIASIKPSTNQIAMISIPRDLGVDIPGYGPQKINHANAYGETDKSGWGGAFATEVIEDTFDIDIQYYARIDFQAFRDIIDEVGGVSVNIERSFTDAEFPAPDEEYQTVSFQKGVQQMNGTRALMFARSRHGNNGEGSDFARSKRQQKILLALKEKVFSASTLLNPLKINGVVASLDKHLTTNMEFSDIIALVKLGKEFDSTNIIRLTIDSSPDGFLENGYTSGGAFILRPKTGDFDNIQKAIKYIFDNVPDETDTTNGEVLREVVKNDTPTQAPPPPPDDKIAVLNGTWRAGLAARATKLLRDDKLSVALIGNTEDRPTDDSGIYALSPSASVDALEKTKEALGIAIKETVPDGVSVDSSIDILVILGEDYQE